MIRRSISIFHSHRTCFKRLLDFCVTSGSSFGPQLAYHPALENCSCASNLGAPITSTTQLRRRWQNSMESVPDNGLSRSRWTNELRSLLCRCGVINEHVGAAMGKFSALCCCEASSCEELGRLDSPLCELPESHQLVLSAQLDSGTTSPRGYHPIAWQPRHKGPG